jgi:DNA excision repair protein ERCC-4
MGVAKGCEMSEPEIILVVDSREQTPWTFQSPTVSGALQYGDYSVLGLESLISIERKSLTDLLGSLTNDRARFETELKRARSLHKFFIIAECSPADLLVESFGKLSRAHPRSVWGTICAWSTRYAPFLFGGDREHAARIAEGILWAYAREFQKTTERMTKACTRGADSTSRGNSNRASMERDGITGEQTR